MTDWKQLCKHDFAYLVNDQPFLQCPTKIEHVHMCHTTGWHPVGCAAHMVSLLTLPQHNMSQAQQVKHKGGRKEECGKETAYPTCNVSPENITLDRTSTKSYL